MDLGPTIPTDDELDVDVCDMCADDDVEFVVTAIDGDEAFLCEGCVAVAVADGLATVARIERVGAWHERTYVR